MSDPKEPEDSEIKEVKQPTIGDDELYRWFVKNKPDGYCAKYEKWVDAGRPESGFAETLSPYCR